MKEAGCADDTKVVTKPLIDFAFLLTLSTIMFIKHHDKLMLSFKDLSSHIATQVFNKPFHILIIFYILAERDRFELSSAYHTNSSKKRSLSHLDTSPPNI